MQPIKAQLTIFKEEPKAKRSYTKRQPKQAELFSLDFKSMEEITGREEIVKPVLHKHNFNESEDVRADGWMKRCVWFKKKK